MSEKTKSRTTFYQGSSAICWDPWLSVPALRQGWLYLSFLYYSL